MTHPDWGTLNDLADGTLPVEAHASTAAHLEECASCRAEFARLGDLRATASSLPAEEPVPAAAWDEIRARIEAGKVVPLGAASAFGDGAHPVGPTGLRFRGRFRAAAAAGLLVAASSATTAWFLHREPPTHGGSEGASPSVAYYTAPQTLPASVVRVERRYTQTVAELSEALQAARNRLAPETVRAIERNLQIVDDAIEEIRAALLRDPASEALLHLLDHNYRQKVDLLKRASAHAEAT